MPVPIKRVTGTLCAIAAAGLLLSAPAAGQEPVRIAVPTFLSGPAAGPFGVPSRNGAELVIDAINRGVLPAPYDSKGFAGRPVDAEYVEEAGGNTKQANEYRNLVQKRGVDAVVGYVLSGSCEAVAPLAEELRRLTVLAVCGTPRIFEEGPRRYLFRTMAHATADSVGAARYVRARYGDVRRYAGLNQDYAWGRDSWRDFDLAMRALVPAARPSDAVLFPRLFAGRYDAEIEALANDPAELVHSSFWDGDLESFVFQGTPRSIFQAKTVIFTVGDTAAYRLGKRMPDGVILGARGPYGILARGIRTPLNDWFIAAYKDRYGTYPSGPSYQFAQAVLATKIAYDRAAQAADGFPSQDQVIDAFTGMTFESFSTEVRMALGGGHQAVTDGMYGLSRWDEEAGEPTVSDVLVFPADCVMPPEGIASADWVRDGMESARCTQ